MTLTLHLAPTIQEGAAPRDAPYARARDFAAIFMFRGVSIFFAA